MKAPRGKIKKPKFLRSYLISLLVMMIIMGTLASFAVIRAKYDYRNEIENYGHSYDSFLEIQLEQKLRKKELTPEDLVKTKMIVVNQYCSTKDVMKLRSYSSDGSGPEFEVDSSRTAFLDYVDEKANHHSLILADNKYLKYFDTPEVEALKIYNLYFDGVYETAPKLEFVCKKAYVDLENCRFIPVEVEMLKGPLLDPDYSGVTVKITPDNTEGYTLVEPKTTEAYDWDKTDGVRYLQQCGEIAGSGDTDFINENECINNVYENEYRFFETYETGPEYSGIISFTNVRTLFIFAVAAALALVLAFVPAAISYNVKMRRYQIFEYRRKMIDAMAHDLKTPMAAIKAYAENLSNHIAPDKQEHYVEKIGEKVSDMNRLVNNILEFSRSEDTAVKIKEEDVDIGQMIEKIISDNETKIKERSLRINYDKKSLTIRTDLELFRQALANLIGNAVIHCKSGTAVDISSDKNSVVIINIVEEKIGDTGKLKEAFVKGSSSRGSKGNGLGLAIADNDLAMLGFKLELRTEDDKFIAIVKL